MQAYTSDYCKCITKSCTRKHFTALVFVHSALLHFFTKTLSVKCSGELGVMQKIESFYG